MNQITVQAGGPRGGRAAMVQEKSLIWINSLRGS
jgi:hypothetical protein